MVKKLSKDLLEVIACPKCKKELKYSESKNELLCKNPECKKKYKVKDGIPIMLPNDIE